VLDESSAGGVVTDLVFSGGTSVQEYAGSISSADLTVEYLRGSDYGGGVGGILYTLRGGTPSYTHENRRGDVVAKTDGSGSLTYQAQYEAFGNQTGTSGSTLDRQKSNSKDTDPTGLVAEGFRYRDLETGMFTSRDPAGFVDGPNLYTYVRQNPWTGFDPEGLMDIMVNGQERPWTVSNQIQATVQNTREMLGGMGEQSQALGSAAMHPVATVENVASGIKNGAAQLYNDPIAATTLAPDAFSPRNVGKGLVNVAAAEVGGEVVGAVISKVKVPGGISAKATLQQRADEIQSALSPDTQKRTTTAVADATTAGGDSVRLVASSEMKLRPAQMDALQPGEVAVSGPGHAEQTIMNHADQNGMQVQAVAASRPICSNCQKAIIGGGAEMASPPKAAPKTTTTAPTP
jgi:RHS repeat-associated protein